MIGYSTEDMTPVFKEIAGVYPMKLLNRMFELEVLNEKKKFNFMVVRKDLDIKDGLFRKNFDKILNPYNYS